MKLKDCNILFDLLFYFIIPFLILSLRFYSNLTIKIGKIILRWTEFPSISNTNQK